MTHEVNTPSSGAPPLDPRLFLRDEELDRGVALFLGAERTLSAAANAARETADLSVVECRILLALRHEPGRDVASVRGDLGATVPTFARLLGALDRRGLIAKARGMMDGRQRRLSLSADGQALIEPIVEAMRDALRRAYRDAGAENVVGARAVLEALKP